jgi:hypothetical protein
MRDFMINIVNGNRYALLPPQRTGTSRHYRLNVFSVMYIHEKGDVEQMGGMTRLPPIY